MHEMSLLQLAQEETDRYEKGAKLRLPDPQKDRDLIEFYQDLAVENGKSHIPLALCEGGAEGCKIFQSNADDLLMILGENLLKNSGAHEAQAIIEHEFGHNTEAQINRGIKDDEIRKGTLQRLRNLADKARSVGDLEEFYKCYDELSRISNTLGRFNAVNEFAADRHATNRQSPRVLAESLKRTFLEELHSNAEVRERLYPGIPEEYVDQEVESELVAPEKSNILHIERINKLRRMAERDSGRN